MCQRIMAEHSPKTLETITRMNTTPESWGIAPMTWRQELRDLNLKVRCKECYGKGWIYGVVQYNGEIRSLNRVWEEMKEAGIIVTGWENKEEPNYVYSYDCFSRDRDGVATKYGVTPAGSSRACPKCYSGRGRKGSGVVYEFTKDVKCDVGYPAWPAETKFPARFSGCDCEMCGKNGIKSGTYPVMARTNDGGIVGMYVGSTCVKRMGLQTFKSVDEQSKKWALSNDRKKGELVVTFIKRTKQVQESVTIEGGETVAPAEKTFPCECGKTFKSRQGRYNCRKKHTQ